MHVLILFFFLATSTAYGGANTYVVGVVPQFDSVQLYRVWRPILNYLQEKTGQKFKLRGAPTIPAFEKEFLRGSFDFSFMNPFHIIVAYNKQGYEPIIRDISTNLHGIVVVNKNNPIKDISELKGKIIAFPAPNSLGATLMIKKDLLDKYGIKIKPYYVQTHSSVYLNVALGLVVAGGGVQKSLLQQPVEIREKLNIIYRTQDVASHPFSAHPRVPKRVKNAVAEALLLLGTTETGRKLLSKIPINVVGRAQIEDYQPIEKMKLERFYQQ
ncbi:MAG: phosphate/phosphite/phosphonate ABC transporter substrate-binding protein [Pseudomonadota bacterium]